MLRQRCLQRKQIPVRKGAMLIIWHMKINLNHLKRMKYLNIGQVVTYFYCGSSGVITAV